MRRELSVNFQGMPAILRPASEPGYWNVWPAGPGPALVTRMIDFYAAELFPQYREEILNYGN